MSLYSTELGFAAGKLIVTPTNVSGIAQPTVVGILQDIQIDLSADLKELYGQNRYAIALAPGKTKVEVKAKFAQMNGALFNNVYFGAAQTATQIMFVDSEAHTIPASVSYTVTATNSAAFLADQGVVYQATGLPLSSASALTSAGQYQNAAGVYTFDSLDAGAAIYLNYTESTSSGSQLTIANPKMGIGPTFSMMLSQPFDGRQQTYIFNNCQSSKLSIPLKQDDWTISEIDFMVAANSAGIIGTINTST